MGKTHVIELNGKQYDAATGELVARAPIATNLNKKSASRPKPLVSEPFKNKSMDGFARPKPAQKQRSVAPAIPSHKSQKSETLMRSAVKKPVIAKTRPPIALSNRQSVTAASFQKSNPDIPKERLEHAKSIPKNSLVQRFGAAVRDAAPSALGQQAKDSAISSDAGQDNISIASIKDQLEQAFSPISRAFDSATSHELPKLNKPSKRARAASFFGISTKTLAASGFALAILLVGGFFVFQAIPSTRMQLATMRSGVHGVIPNYRPAGFSQAGPIIYKPGQITLDYKSTTDARNFTITQANSDWNSESLRENFSSLNTNNIQEIQDKGKTIYLYGDNNATWVDGGVWYRVEGNSQLNSNQLLNIASGL